MDDAKLVAICAIVYSTALKRDLPVGFNFESICVLGHSELCTELKNGVNKIGGDLNITLDRKNLIDDLYHLVGNDLRLAVGIQG